MGFYEEDKKYVLNTYKRIPVEIEKGQGGYVWDVNGKKYLDFFSGIAVLHLGHNHKELSKRIKDQIDKYMHLSNYFASEPVVALAKKLVDNTFATKVFFTNSGTESNEGALKMAVKWGREINKDKIEVVSSLNSFHGRSTGGLALTGQPEKQEPFNGLLPKVKHFDYNSIESLKKVVNENTCAIFLEAIQGEGGIVELDKNFVNELNKLKKEFNFLVIMDEIQAGLGRTARELLAFEAYGVEADIATLAKGIGGGLPLGAILVGEKVEGTFTFGDHGTTFGGNPVACAGGNYILELMTDKIFMDKVTENADYLREKLEGLRDKYNHIIKEIRGRGFMLGLEMGSYAETARVEGIEKGMLLNVTAKSVLRLIPRIDIPKEEIDEFLLKFEEILKSFN